MTYTSYKSYKTYKATKKIGAPESPALQWEEAYGQCYQYSCQEVMPMESTGREMKAFT